MAPHIGDPQRAAQGISPCLGVPRLDLRRADRALHPGWLEKHAVGPFRSLQRWERLPGLPGDKEQEEGGSHPLQPA